MRYKQLLNFSKRVEAAITHLDEVIANIEQMIANFTHNSADSMSQVKLFRLNLQAHSVKERRIRLIKRQEEIAAELAERLLLDNY